MTTPKRHARVLVPGDPEFEAIMADLDWWILCQKAMDTPTYIGSETGPDDDP